MEFGYLDLLKKFSMEVSLSKSIRIPIKIYAGDNLNLNSLILWVWHADKIPPHIGISFNQLYFSLKASGKDGGVEIEHVVNLLNKKTISTLAFELDELVDIDTISTIYDDYSMTIPNDVTCLTPIKKALCIDSVSKLDELLLELSAKNAIKQCIGFNIAENFKGLKEYNSSDIHARLLKLKDERSR